MNEFLKMRKLRDGCPVMIAEIPKQIKKEIAEWVKESRKFKDSPLSNLKKYDTGNRGTNISYQCPPPCNLVENSFWLAWVLKLSAEYWGMGRSDREFRLRKWDGHSDGYDIWVNFSNKGDYFPSHTHSGFLSGVMYYRNHGVPTIFDDYNCSYEGKDGTMVMFPVTTVHRVGDQILDKERITLSFNIAEREVSPYDDFGGGS